MRYGEGEGKGKLEFGSVILTLRLMLRHPEARDRDAIAALAANPGVAENLAAAPGDNGGRSFALVERESGAVIGAAGYGPIPDRPRAAEIASWVGEPYWGRGFATEASQALIDHVFADEDILVLWCSNRPSNTRARRVIEKCGFQFRGPGMVRSPTRNVAVPVERFLLDRRNWVSLKSWGAPMPRKERRDAPRNNAA
jgi:RimJ/RimL family protein N-acetyltransferase